MKPPAVAIVGVPNVGKSTLFNRLVGRRRSLVGPTPGVTRDRIHAEMEVGGRTVILIDTGGIHAEPDVGLDGQVHLQARVAMEEAAVLVLLLSAREGLSPAEMDLARTLRRGGRPVLVVVNKVDHAEVETHVPQFYELGLGDPIAISAEHGIGIGELRERLEALLPQDLSVDSEEDVRKLAIVGRPNVGKSSLLNALAREERAIVSAAAGTTRDTVDLVLESGGRHYRIVDTAGIRRSARTPDPIDRLSSLRARTALQEADVALVVLDGSQEVTAQDQAVAGLARKFCRPLILVANKWDLLPSGEEARAAFLQEIAHRFRFARFAPARFVSARTGEGVEGLLPAAEALWEEGASWAGAGRLNRFLRTIDRHHSARDRNGRPVRCYYIAQTGVHPPAFTIFTNSDAPAHFAFRRFVENRLRDELGLRQTPIVLHWRRK